MHATFHAPSADPQIMALRVFNAQTGAQLAHYPLVVSVKGFGKGLTVTYLDEKVAGTAHRVTLLRKGLRLELEEV